MTRRFPDMKDPLPPRSFVGRSVATILIVVAMLAVACLIFPKGP